MARISFGLSNRQSMRPRKTKAKIDEKDTSTELGVVCLSEKGDRLTARFGFAERPDDCLDSTLDSYTDYDHNINPFEDAMSSTAPIVNEQAWEALVSRNNTSRAQSDVRSSSLSSRRRSVGANSSGQRSLCEMMCDAASSGDVPQVGRLLGAGADPKKKSKEGLPPVHLAAAGGHLGVLKSLAMHGAKMDAMDGLGRTALHAAVVGKHADVIPFLVQSGVPLDTKDADGFTALQLASQMKGQDRREELDLETTRNGKVRFSYMFGASKAAKRESTCSTSSLLHTPLEALSRAGASGGNVGIESRL
ncbi:hypothetical protein EG328_000253 [Venturia inaequalis]|nr:hypothetical protein EG328_000253 [Venturia inaequalis]KAE9989976.1 hypothetical protein EG327_001987 [Venturia inaequalis]